MEFNEELVALGKVQVEFEESSKDKQLDNKEKMSLLLLLCSVHDINYKGFKYLEKYFKLDSIDKYFARL